MQTAAILDAATRQPSSEQTWRRIALEFGNSLAHADRVQVSDLIDGLSRLARVPAEPVVEGFRQALLAMLSGRAQALARERESVLEDQDLRKHDAKEFWAKVARAAAKSSGGIVRNRDICRLLDRNKSQVSAAMKGMLEARLFERLEGDLEADGRAELFRILPAGRRLAEIAPPEQKRHRPFVAMVKPVMYVPIATGKKMDVRHWKEERGKKVAFVVHGQGKNRLLCKADVNTSGSKQIAISPLPLVTKDI
jgi:DNA-binding MarR family transcriptional regulator